MVNALERLYYQNDYFIKWIPYSNLENLEFLTSGGNSNVYSGTWNSIKIILKAINSEDVNDIINEFKIHHKCRGQTVIPFYGVTRMPEKNKFAMVIKHAKHGDLRNYIRQSFSNLTWTDRVNILIKLSEAIDYLHKMGLLHRDLHSKNILVDGDKIYISDFGLCQPIDSEIGSIEGVLPYIAPEVLRQKPYTIQSEIYSLGMIMWELTSNQPPFSNYYDSRLLTIALAVDELRPMMIKGTPDFYANIMKRCWSNDPSQRPEASQLLKIFKEMLESCKTFDNDFDSQNFPVIKLNDEQDITFYYPLNTNSIYTSENEVAEAVMDNYNSLFIDLQTNPLKFEEKEVIK
ncbi:8857_t:CDS:2 [Funneliformis geosporum]|uniref:8857_t:CDS:1 n=1 Tax=Funneliformis geosporum TaxID=1117311 RepID=A0A9W4SS19_9GLOM|nr:8857_t:CDS:2 [Funneliformis geosporum]